MRFQLTAVGLACATLLSACGGGDDPAAPKPYYTQTIDFTSPGTQTLPSVPKALTATTTSKLPVTFTSDTPTICTVVDGTLIPVMKGECSITANQAGDAIYHPAWPKQRVFNIIQAAQDITFTSPGDLPISEPPPALVATSTSGLAVSFTSKTTTICTVSGTTLTLVSMGECEIVANQDGNNDYPAVEKSVKFAVLAALPPVLTFASGYQAVDNFRSTEDGRLDMYAGAALASTAERSVAGDGSTYTYTLNIASAIAPDWAYQGFRVFAPGVVDLATDGDTAGGIRINGQTAIKYSVMMNPEWITAGNKNFRVQLYLGHSNGDNCNVRLVNWQNLAFTDPVAGVQEQSMNLADFEVEEACGLGTLDVATELANYPISEIEFNIPDPNRSVKTTGTDNYVTSFTVGKVIFK